MSLLNALNRSMPAAKRAGLGTRIAALETTVNALATALDTIHLQNRFLLTAPTLVIKAAEGTVPKSSGAFTALVAGTYVSKAANTDMCALSGTTAATKYALYDYYMDSAGTITTAKAADAATAAAALALLPTLPINKVRLGYIIVHNGSGSSFVGGTTALDATDITVTYVNGTTTDAFTAAPVSVLT